MKDEQQTYQSPNINEANKIINETDSLRTQPNQKYNTSNLFSNSTTLMGDGSRKASSIA